MKKRYWAAAAAIAMGVAGTALAATLENGSGQSCGAFIGTWHFVNNQTGGATGPLTASFSSGTISGIQPSKVNANNVQYIVIASGTLLTAYNSLPGRLVLSDFSCEDTKEPPPCDPHKEICK